jgi:hypothetical protein
MFILSSTYILIDKINSSGSSTCGYVENCREPPHVTRWGVRHQALGSPSRRKPQGLWRKLGENLKLSGAREDLFLTHPDFGWGEKSPPDMGATKSNN